MITYRMTGIVKPVKFTLNDCQFFLCRHVFGDGLKIAQVFKDGLVCRVDFICKIQLENQTVDELFKVGGLEFKFF